MAHQGCRAMKKIILFSNNLCISRNVRDQFSHPNKTTEKIIVLKIVILIYLDRNGENKGSVPKCITYFPEKKTLFMRPNTEELNLIFVVPSIMLYGSEISPTRCNNCVFILRNGFTLHVSGYNLTHHQEYICCI